MTIEFRCPHCSARLSARDDRAGAKYRCQKCGGEGVIPKARPEKTPARKTPAGPLPLRPTDADGPAPLQFTRKRATEDDIDMTPMVDVVFQLLIFFMVTAAFSLQKSIEVPPPDKEESSTQARTMEEIEQDDDYVIIRIARDNTVWVNEREAPSEQEVLVRLREAREGVPGTSTRGPTSLLVVADPESRHETVVMCLDAGNEVGMENIRLACIEEENL